MHAYTFATSRDTGDIALQMTLYVIAMHVNVETGQTYAGVRTLMREAKIKSDKTMRNYLKELEAMGFIKREKRQRTNGGKTTDNIELCGFLKWFRALRGEPEMTPPVNSTGGDPPVDSLPDPPVASLPDPPVDKATGLTNSSSNKKTNKKKAPLPENQEAAAAVSFPITEDWSLPEGFASWALKESPEHGGMIHSEAKKFARYWREQAAVGTEAEWLKRWQNWFERTIARPPAKVAAIPMTAKNWHAGPTVRNTEVPFAVELADAIKRGVYKPAKVPA
jgi:hypothetical protein